MYINKSATNTETKRKKIQTAWSQIYVIQSNRKGPWVYNDVNDYSDLGIISKQV